MNVLFITFLLVHSVYKYFIKGDMILDIELIHKSPVYTFVSESFSFLFQICRLPCY